MYVFLNEMLFYLGVQHTQCMVDKSCGTCQVSDPIQSSTPLKKWPSTGDISDSYTTLDATYLDSSDTEYTPNKSEETIAEAE